MARDCDLILCEDGRGVGRFVADVLRGTAEHVGQVLHPDRYLIPFAQVEDPLHVGLLIARAFAHQLVAWLGFVRLACVEEVVARRKEVGLIVRRDVGVGREEVFDACAPGISAVLEVVIVRCGGPTRDVAEVAASQLEGEAIGGVVGESLVDVVGVEAGGGYLLGLHKAILLVALVRTELPALGLAAAIGGVGAESARVDVGRDRLGEASVRGVARVGREVDGMLYVVRDDVHHAADRVRAVERRGGAAEDLNALDARDVDAFVGVVAAHPTTVFEEDEVFLRQPVQAERRAHAVGHVREGGGQFLQGFVEG